MIIQTLGLSLRAKGKEGDPLPPVFQRLEAVGAKFRRGQVTLIAGAPGTGKSTLATVLALYVGLPAIYFSADSDKTTFGARTASNLFPDISLANAEDQIIKEYEPLFEDIDEHTTNLWISFDPSPSCRDIDEEIDCFAHVYGRYPELVVIDNLMDINHGAPDDWIGHQDVINFCRQLARRIVAAVVVLCHVSGRSKNDRGFDDAFYTDGNTPVPLSGLMNKIDKSPRLVLTLYRNRLGEMGVCLVKNTNGEAKSDGTMRVGLPWAPAQGGLSRW